MKLTNILSGQAPGLVQVAPDLIALARGEDDLPGAARIDAALAAIGPGGPVVTLSITRAVRPSAPRQVHYQRLVRIATRDITITVEPDGFTFTTDRRKST